MRKSLSFLGCFALAASLAMGVSSAQAGGKYHAPKNLDAPVINLAGGAQINALTVQLGQNNLSAGEIAHNDVSTQAFGNSISGKQINDGESLALNAGVGVQVNLLSAQLSQSNLSAGSIAHNDVSTVSVGNAFTLEQENLSSKNTANVGLGVQANIATIQAAQGNFSAGSLTNNTFSSAAAGNSFSFSSLNQD